MTTLKFKEIRKSIISQKDFQQNDLSLIKRNLFVQPQDSQMSFKSIKQSIIVPSNAHNPIQHQVFTNKKKYYFEDSAEKKSLSPLSNKKKIEENIKFQKVSNYDSDKKNLNYERITSRYGSDQKSNLKKTILFQRENNSTNPLQELFINNKECKILYDTNQVQAEKERKINTLRENQSNIFLRPESKSDFLYQTTIDNLSAPNSLTKKNSMLFKAALQTSNKKKTLRKHGQSNSSRQSSIGKLKQKLFGLRKIVSQKQNRPNQNLSQIESEYKLSTVYTKKNNEDKFLKKKLKPLAEIRSQITQISTQKGDKNFMKLKLNSKNSKDILFTKNCQKLNSLRYFTQSGSDAVNYSLASSFDSILDMSPNL